MNYNHRGLRFDLCSTGHSHFKTRQSLPRSLVCLYSRWRLNCQESCGSYPRKLKFLIDPRCTFCGAPVETTIHLIRDCPGTFPVRYSFGISPTTLQCDTENNILRITQFDLWIRRSRSYDNRPNNQGSLQRDLTAAFVSRRLSQTGKRTSSQRDSPSEEPAPKRRRFARKRRLVIPTLPKSYQAPKRRKRNPTD